MEDGLQNHQKLSLFSQKQLELQKTNFEKFWNSKLKKWMVNQKNCTASQWNQSAYQFSFIKFGIWILNKNVKIKFWIENRSVFPAGKTSFVNLIMELSYFGYY
jgi:hypothetical protein